MLALLELLQNGGTHTVPTLAGRLGVDERTLRRYARHLTDLGIPIESRRGRYGGYRLLAGYSRTLKWSLENGSFIMILLGIVIVLNVHLYGLLPKGFFPWMDQGRIQGGVRGDQSASFELTRTKIEAFEKILRADPAVESVQLTTGGNGGGGGGGFVSVTLKPKSVRKLNTEEVINRMRPMLAEVPGANIFLFTPQDIRVGGRQGNSPFQYTLLSDDVEALREWGPKLEAALKEVPQLLDVSTDQQERGLETEIQIDRATASLISVRPWPAFTHHSPATPSRMRRPSGVQ